MTPSRTLYRLFVLLAAATAAAGAEAPPASAPSTAIAPGPFAGTLESLKQYKCPEWFRDAKLGIWAHWGPQSVPMAGDWYARNMYIQGERQYKDHLDNYGHPSKLGYKDIIPLWKAEKWDPDRLMGMYKKAGAKYFVSMACHHDNFDLWNSTYHKWNAVNMGPHRDVVGDWQKAAVKVGLRFGVSEHMGASFTWFQAAHGSDKTGPLAGVPYDGADPKYEELYHWPAAKGDTGWYSNDPRWHREWFSRIKDLIDQYKPDLLYTDGGVPFGNEVGRSMIAHLYNASAQRHGGTAEVVYTCKQQSNGMWIEDLERGVMAKVRPEPWQTDTSIGDWYYNKSWKYRGADWVIQMLVDIVSKNGNLLINVVQRPDGSLDPEAEGVLDKMAAWMAINGEAIFQTRPWLAHGEGPIKAKGGHFGEDFAYTAKDIRFTTKGDKGDKTLYAFIMGWPTDGKVLIRSLAKLPETTGTIAEVSLLGSPAKLTWTHTADGLAVQLPADKPCDYAVALKITGENLRGFAPEAAAPKAAAVAPDAAGNFTLTPDDAELHGDGIKAEAQGGQPNIGFWDNAQDWASWKLKFPAAGKYTLTASIAAAKGDSAVTVELAGQKLEAKLPATEGWDKFATVELGTVEIKQPGEQTLAIKPRDAASWKAVNLRWVKMAKGVN
jgi:alpha-L-fucosidase